MDADSNRYVVVEDGDAWPDEHMTPIDARHVSISRCPEASEMVLDLRNMEYMEVLHLLGNEGRQEIWMRGNYAHLRSLIVSVPTGAELRCHLFTEIGTRPRFNLVKFLKLHGNINVCVTQGSQLMSPQVVSRLLFPNLEILELGALPDVGQLLDVKHCASLKKLIVKNIPGLKFIRGPDNHSKLLSVQISSLPQLQEFTFTGSNAYTLQVTVHHCDSLQKIALGCRTRSPSLYAGPLLVISVCKCPLLTNVDGLSQFASALAIFRLSDRPASFKFNYETAVFGYEKRNNKRESTEKIGKLATGSSSVSGNTPHKFLTDMFGEIVKDAGVDSSLCKAAVKLLTFGRRESSLGLADLEEVCLLEARHIEMFITALFNAKLRKLQRLEITCHQGGDCGCDQYPPQFGLLGAHRLSLLQYDCPKVRDLTSLSNCFRLEELILRGCTAVKIWPEFSGMTSLEFLDLSHTSLKEWPATSLLHLLSLRRPILTNGVQRMMSTCLIRSLRDDMFEGRRKRSTIADALEAHSLEIGAVFDQWSPCSSTCSSGLAAAVVPLVVELMYFVCFGCNGVNDGEELLATRMKGLLCSGSFLSLAYRACSNLCSSYQNEAERVSWKGVALCVRGVALVKEARILGACHNAAPARNYDADVEAIIIHCDYLLYNCGGAMSKEELRGLVERVTSVMSSSTSMESGKDIVDAFSEALRSKRNC